jgi:hypothetical protein
MHDYQMLSVFLKLFIIGEDSYIYSKGQHLMGIHRRWPRQAADIPRPVQQACFSGADCSFDLHSLFSPLSSLVFVSFLGKDIRFLSVDSVVMTVFFIILHP